MNINLICLFDSRRSILTTAGSHNPIRGLCYPACQGTGTWSGQFILGQALGNYRPSNTASIHNSILYLLLPDRKSLRHAFLLPIVRFHPTSPMLHLLSPTGHTRNNPCVPPRKSSSACNPSPVSPSNSPSAFLCFE
jgi:hypothetical protein